MTTTIKPLAKNTLRTAGLISAKSATFGPVRFNPDGSIRNHQGIDLAADAGTPILAVGAGQIVGINLGKDGYGWTLTLKTAIDGKPIYAFYAHLSQISVQPGDKVTTGQPLGNTGSTGNAKGMDTVNRGGHLHFELRQTAAPGPGLNGRIDPQPYIALDQ